jgi:hypothetical protein
VIDRQEAGGSPTTTAAVAGSKTNATSGTSATAVSAGTRMNHCSFISNDVLYVFGGQASSSSSSLGSLPLFASLNLASQFENATTPSWETLPSNNAVPVLNPQCVSTGTHLLVIGGQPVDSANLYPNLSGQNVFCGMQAYSFEDQVWQNLMPQQTSALYINLNRTGHVAEWFQDVGNGNPGLFVFGGMHYNASTPANDAFMLSPFTIPAPGGQALIGVTSIPNNLPPPTDNSGSTLTGTGTSLLLFGGEAQPTMIWEYTPKTTAWKKLSVALPQAMPNAVGFVDAKDELVVVDLTTSPGNDICTVPLSTAGLRKRQAPSSSGPTMNGYSVAFDTTRNVAIVTGGNTNEAGNLNMFNSTDNSWSVLSLQKPLVHKPSVTATPSATRTTIALSTSTSAPASTTAASAHNNAPDSTGFNKSNLLAPIILGSILGLLGLIGIIFLLCSYRRRKAKKTTHKSETPAGLWLKYGNKDPNAKPGEIFLRNLEEKHGVKRSQSEARRTGWSKYFSASWYMTSNPAPRASTSTSNTARALVNETRDHAGPYGGGWDTESRYSKASSLYSVEEHDTRRDTFERWSGIRWSFVNKPRDSRASSGVLGDTLGTLGAQGTSFIGAGGVNKL